MPLPGQNVLFITGDQLQFAALGCNGHPVVKTPNLDALAADGVMFTKHFTNVRRVWQSGRAR